MGWTDAVSSLPLDPGKVLTASLNNTHLWPAKRSQTSKMRHLPSQFPSVLVIYCFCMLQIPSSGKGTDTTSARPEFYRRLIYLPCRVVLTRVELLCPPILTSTLLLSGVALVSNQGEGHSETHSLLHRDFLQRYWDETALAPGVS